MYNWCYFMYNWGYFSNILLTRKRKIQNNTYIVNLDGPDYPKSLDDINEIGIRFHNTIIITHRRDNSVRLRNNGWQGILTAQRINNYQSLGLVVSSHGEWYVKMCRDRVDYLYHENMILLPNGCVYDSKGKQLESIDIHEERLAYNREKAQRRRRQNGVRRYADRIITVDDWEAHFITDSTAVHYVHLCEKNLQEKNAAINCKEGKRCRWCKTIVPHAFLMTTQLQKLR